MINESPALCRFELCYLFLDERISMQIQYDNQFLTRSFKKLYNKIKWEIKPVTVFGKTYPQPRLTAWYSYDTKPYSYSNLELKPIAVTKELHEIFQIIEQEIKIKFNSVLLNLYRDGQDSNGWHADNEKELGKNPIIASITLGEVRPFHFKHISIKEEKHKIKLEHGSLLLMHGEMQHYWVHHIPKTKKEIKPRINLTFRNIK